MTNLNELQLELAALTERVNSAMELTKDSFTFTTFFHNMTIGM